MNTKNKIKNKNIDTIDVLLFQLCNTALLKLTHPLALNQIEISQCVENLEVEDQSTDDGETHQTVKRRPIIAKFVSRGTKASVMAARKLLKPRKRPDAELADAEQVDDEDRVRFLMDWFYNPKYFLYRPT